MGSSGGGSPQHAPLGPPQHTAARQRSRSPAARGHTSLPYMGNTNNAFENQAFNHLSADNAYYQSKISRRSVSPSPARKFANRPPSPNPIRKLSTQNTAVVPSNTLVPNPHKNYRSRSPTPKVPQIESRKGNISPEKESLNIYDNNSCEGASTLDNIGNGSENASDNGSEVSDEGYRSLGVIQQGSGSTQASPPSVSSNSKDLIDRGLNMKLNRLSLGSQTSAEDADITGWYLNFLFLTCFLKYLC